MFYMCIFAVLSKTQLGSAFIELDLDSQSLKGLCTIPDCTFFSDLFILTLSNVSQTTSDPPIKICYPSTCNTRKKFQHGSLSILERIREEINQLLPSLSVALRDSEENVI